MENKNKYLVNLKVKKLRLQQTNWTKHYAPRSTKSFQINGKTTLGTGLSLCVRNQYQELQYVREWNHTHNTVFLIYNNQAMYLDRPKE